MKELDEIVYEKTGKQIEELNKKELLTLLSEISIEEKEYNSEETKNMIKHNKKNLFCNKPGYNNLGEREFLTKEEIRSYYVKLKLLWSKQLKEDGVKLPQLYSGNSYTLDSLVLIYLFHKFKKKVSKQELSRFLKNMGRPSNNMQQARHLGQQKGWYIISGQRKDIGSKKYNLKSGDYALISVKKPYPSFRAEKRNCSLTESKWEEIKNSYDNRCATCGSKEGQPHLYYKSHKTQLTKGHMDPQKPLSNNNVIPQCQMCNRSSLNNFVFDKKGRVKAVNNPDFIKNSSEEIQKEIFKILQEKFSNIQVKISEG